MSADEEAIAATAARIVELESFRADYSRLLDTLRPLPLKTAHSIKVPVCPVAFAPGKLIHTNEMLVALGDGYFAGANGFDAHRGSCDTFPLPAMISFIPVFWWWCFATRHVCRASMRTHHAAHCSH